MIKIIQSNRVLKILTATFMTILLIPFLMTFIPTKSAYSAEAVVFAPLVPEAVGGLLVALGLATVTAEGVYILNESYPYISDFLKDLGGSIYDVFKALPEDFYYSGSDGNYYLSSGEMVTDVSQLLLSAEYLPTRYSFPVNTKFMISSSVWTSKSALKCLDYDALLDRGSNQWYIPFYRSADATHGDFALSKKCYQFGLSSTQFASYYYFPSLSDDLNAKPTFTVELSPYRRAYITPFASNIAGSITTKYAISGDQITSLSSTQFAGNVYSSNIFSTSYFRADGSSAPSELYNSGFDVLDYGYLTTGIEMPRFEIDVDGKELDEVYISPAPDYQPPDDPNNDDKDPTLLPPDLWEIFKTVKDFLDKTNNNTTLKDYVNNNYNYNVVDVDVNIPESFHIYFDSPLDVNLSLSGGVNVDITINDKTELPSISEGDGENFYSANVIDVFAGLTKNNPIMTSLTALFGVIDPGLVAIFSVTTSLMLLLAIWRLIRR